MPKPVLIVEDDELQREMLSTLLMRKLEFASQTAIHGKAALDILNKDESRSVKLIIMDLDMPVMGGIETLKILNEKHPDIPVIMLTGSNDIDDAVQCLKLGAVDFINKPYEGDRMVVTVKNALKLSTLSKEVVRLKKESEGTASFQNLIGHDGGLADIINLSQKAAASNIPVLLTGETGTGKEVFAKAIHGESSRSGKAFIPVNCGAIPSQLVESTLFGHEKGSFTGAAEQTIGKFREANGGTIFLDEVGELPLDTQVKLLRVLQQKEVEPVGAGKPVAIDVRIISATNRDLKKEIERGTFREDLYFRLNVLELHLPPLRERKQDILKLSDHFIERYCAMNNAIPKPLSEETRKKFINFDWPGNVRQLENIINRAMVVCEGTSLNVSDFSVFSNGDPSASPVSENNLNDKDYISLKNPDGTIKSIDDIEQEAMRWALNHYDDNITKASEALGIAKSTFYRKMRS